MEQYVKKGERPDRIYGLRSSSRLEQLVDAAFDLGSDMLMAREVEISPFARSESSGNPLLFPFLVLESKSEIGPANDQSIFYQTAFAIRRLLLLQKGLCDHPDVKHKFSYGPFVWFLFHRGPAWTVAGAYISRKGSGEQEFVSHFSTFDTSLTLTARYPPSERGYNIS